MAKRCSTQGEVSRARKSQSVKSKKEREGEGNGVGGKPSVDSNRIDYVYFVGDPRRELIAVSNP